MHTAVLQEYLDVLQEAGLRCEAVDIATNCAGKLFHACYPEIPTAIVLQINEASVDLRLLENDFCVFSRHIRLNANRLLQDGGIELLAEELADHVNKILQFQTTRHKQQRVGNVLLLCNLDNRQMLMDKLSALLEPECTFFALGSHVKMAPGINIGAMECARGLGAAIRKNKSR